MSLREDNVSSPGGSAVRRGPGAAWRCPVGLQPSQLPGEPGRPLGCPPRALSFRDHAGWEPAGRWQSGSGVVWPRVCLIKYPDTHQALPGLHLAPPPTPQQGPHPQLSGQPSGKESLVGSHPFPQVQALRSVTSHPFLGVSYFVCLYYL